MSATISRRKSEEKRLKRAKNHNVILFRRFPGCFVPQIYSKKEVRICKCVAKLLIRVKRALLAEQAEGNISSDTDINALLLEMTDAHNTPQDSPCAKPYKLRSILNLDF
ncbi:hypothetical protein DSO57_1002797 [Entomophthora muscae]|uniref:Uncharacterized protein n=1 Tax=Entomophthora muscae TaxID=34485 RepID=A0ACC2SAF2_9FUNG|nr:hypothetical protein DSO57_1002797 [Entomophthora muscae]